MSVVNDVIREEFDRLNCLAKLYDDKISEYPKGSISEKKRNGLPYCYLAFREKGKVRFVYLGKKDSEEVNKVAAQISQRHSYEEKKKQVNANLKEIRKLLHVINR